MKTNISVVPKMIGKNPVFAMNTLLSFLAGEKAKIIDYNFLNGKTKALSLLYLRITPLCNLRCIMCGQGGVHGVLKGKTAAEEAKTILPIEKYKELIDEVSVKRPLLYVWGGEPFLYPDFMDLAEYMAKSKCILSVNTNGTFLKKNAERIVRDKWQALFVSLDGFEDVNDAIRGTGSYKKVVDGFKAINKEKAKQGSHLPYMGIVTTVSNMNYRYLDKLTEAAMDFNLAWHIINLGTYTNEAIFEKNKKFMKETFNTDINCLKAYATGYNQGIDGEIFAEILNKIHGMNPGYPIITVPVINPDKIGTYYSSLETVVRYKCPVPWSQANIDYNGNVHFCADYNDYILGNIKDDSFFNIFNNERAVKFRQELKKSPNGIFPGCVRCYQNMLFGKRKKGF